VLLEARSSTILAVPKANRKGRGKEAIDMRALLIALVTSLPLGGCSKEDKKPQTQPRSRYRCSRTLCSS
jgi:hypothetical protein